MDTRALLLALLALTACTTGPVTLEGQGQVVGGQLAYGAPTLNAASRAFFGDSGGSGSGSGGGDGGGGGGGDNDLLSPENPVTLQGYPPSVTQLILSRSDDLGGGVRLRASAMVGHQHLLATLPDGLGILTDPMQIEIWAQSLGVQMTLGQRLPLAGGLNLDYAAGLGLSHVAAATHLQSALIDLRGRSQQTLPYAVLETRLQAQSGPALLGEILVFQSGAREVRLGMAQPF